MVGGPMCEIKRCVQELRLKLFGGGGIYTKGAYRQDTRVKLPN